MGVKGLLPFLRAAAPSARQPLADGAAVEAVLHGRRVAVDVAIEMHKAAYIRRSADVGVLCAWFEDLARRLRRDGATPTWVFDGAQLDAKAGEVARRTQARVNAAVRAAMARARVRLLQEAEADAIAAAACGGGSDSSDSDVEGGGGGGAARHVLAPQAQLMAAERDLQRAEARLLKPQREHYDAVRAFLCAHGDVCVVAATEAEKECARMAARGEVDIVITNDSDALPFGAPVTLFNYGRPTAYLLHLDAVLRALAMPLPTFRAFCVMCGCDFCPRVPGVGPVAVRKRLAEVHGGGVAAVLRAAHDKGDPRFTLAVVEARAAAAADAVAALASQAAVLSELADADAGSVSAALAVQWNDTRARLDAARAVYAAEVRQFAGIVAFEASWEDALRIFSEAD